MKQMIQIVVAVLIFVSLVLYSTFPASAAPAVYTDSSAALQDAELPPDIFDDECDGGSTCPGRIFLDMPVAGHWSHVPIDWALTHHITSGTSAYTFSPGRECTRAQAVTFLWRANGSPEPETLDCPFQDVPETAYYYKAVLWAIEKQITTGTTATTFSPGQICTRAQIVTFLWRAKGSPSVSNMTEPFPFQDVGARAYYRNAIVWAISSGVTGGTSATTFSPSKACTRAQIVTFLYKANHG